MQLMSEEEFNSVITETIAAIRDLSQRFKGRTALLKTQKHLKRVNNSSYIEQLKDEFVAMRKQYNQFRRTADRNPSDDGSGKERVPWQSTI